MGFEERWAIKGPLILDRLSIIINVPSVPGAFMLIKSDGSLIISVDRTDNLLNSLLNHLPENETSKVILELAPDRCLFQIAPDLENAYDIECRWYHMLKPICCKAHPRFLPHGKPCPVCGES
jgi:hypothetical protein